MSDDCYTWRLWMDICTQNIRAGRHVRHITLIFKRFSIRPVGLGIFMPIGKVANDNEISRI